MKTCPRTVALVGAAAFALLVSAAPAEAQFGGMLNKAKEKMAQKGADQLGPVAPGEQITDDLLGKVITGVQAADRVMGDRDRAVADRDAKNKQLSALLDKNQPVHRAYEEANSKILECRNTSFDGANERRKQQMDARYKEIMGDPNMVGKMTLISMKYSRAMAEAQQKNDAAGLQKAQMQMMQEVTGMDVFAELKKDTLAADSKCGKPPALPAALAQEEQLRKDVSDLDGKIRTLEAQAINVGAQASGMEQLRYLQLKERALSIMNRMAGQGAQVKFGDDEMAAVRKRQGELEKLKRAL